MTNTNAIDLSVKNLAVSHNMSNDCINNNQIVLNRIFVNEI